MKIIKAIFMGFPLGLLLLIPLACHHIEPKPPTPAPQLNYSPAVRIPHGEVSDVWRLHLESKLIGQARVLEDGRVLIPLRIFGEAQNQKVDWDFDKRAVFIGGKRVPSDVFLIIQTAYAAPEILGGFADERIEVLKDARTVIVHGKESK